MNVTHKHLFLFFVAVVVVVSTKKLRYATLTLIWQTNNFSNMLIFKERKKEKRTVSLLMFLD